MRKVAMIGALSLFFFSGVTLADFSDLANDSCRPEQGEKCKPKKDKPKQDKDQDKPKQDKPKQDKDKDQDRPKKGKPTHGECPNGLCEFPTKEVCFNLVCHYKGDKYAEFENCRAAAKFNKAVTLDGGEVADESTLDENPELEVSCDDNVLFSGPARRFTDLLGTRIQGETGPFPGILLPRGALHGNFPEDSGSHVSYSVLEVDTGVETERLRGRCHIWTGAP